MTCRNGMGMMVVVPAFAERYHRDPPIIGRIIFGDKAPAAPHVRRGIDEPCGVQTDGHSEEDTPHQVGQAAHRHKNDAECRQRNPVPFGKPNMDFVATKVWSVAFELRIAVVQDFPADDPSHVRPPAAVARTVRIALAIASLMMNAVRTHPEDWPTFKRKRCASREEVFEPFWNFVSAMRQQAVVAHADSKAQRKIPEN